MATPDLCALKVTAAPGRNDAVAGLIAIGVESVPAFVAVLPLDPLPEDDDPEFPEDDVDEPESVLEPVEPEPELVEPELVEPELVEPELLVPLLAGELVAVVADVVTLTPDPQPKKLAIPTMTTPASMTLVTLNLQRE